MKIQKTMRGLVRAEFLGRLPWGNHGEKVMRDKIENCFGDDVIGVIKEQEQNMSFNWVWVYKLRNVELENENKRN